MNDTTQFPDLNKLWERCKFLYNSVEKIGDQLKFHYESFKETYHNICRYFSKFCNRNPSELQDLININSLRRKPTSATSQVFLEEIDFINVERMLEMFSSLQELHDFITRDVMKILARDHTIYFEQKSHQRRFNKVLRCVYDVRLALESLHCGNGEGKSYKSDSNLPPHEKMWYLFCLVERESLAVCSILESVGTWEKDTKFNDSEECILPFIHGKYTRICKNERFKRNKIMKNKAQTITQENWQTNLRNYKTPNYNKNEKNSLLNNIIQRCESPKEVIVNENLRINKWNLREPQQSPKTINPLFNKAFFFRSKNAISKPHGILKPYLAKISTECEQQKNNKNNISLHNSSNKVRGHSNQNVSFNNTLRQFNTKLDSLEQVVSQLIAERQQMEQRIIDPLRKQVNQGLEWLKTHYSANQNSIETTQEKINKLKMEKSLFFRGNKKLSDDFQYS